MEIEVGSATIRGIRSCAITGKNIAYGQNSSTEVVLARIVIRHAHAPLQCQGANSRVIEQGGIVAGVDDVAAKLVEDVFTAMDAHTNAAMFTSGAIGNIYCPAAQDEMLSP